MERITSRYTDNYHGPSAGTLGSIIVFPTKKEFWVTDNYPCNSEYEKFSL